MNFEQIDTLSATNSTVGCNVGLGGSFDIEIGVCFLSAIFLASIRLSIIDFIAFVPFILFAFILAFVLLAAAALIASSSIIIFLILSIILVSGLFYRANITFCDLDSWFDNTLIPNVPLILFNLVMLRYPDLNNPVYIFSIFAL